MTRAIDMFMRAAVFVGCGLRVDRSDRSLATRTTRSHARPRSETSSMVSATDRMRAVTSSRVLVPARMSMTRPSSRATSAQAISSRSRRGTEDAGCHALVEDLEVDRDLSPVERMVGVVERASRRPSRPELVQDARLVALEPAGDAGLDRRIQPRGRGAGLGHGLRDRLDEAVARGIHQFAHDLTEPAEVVEHGRGLHAGGGRDGSQRRALGALVHGDSRAASRIARRRSAWRLGRGIRFILPRPADAASRGRDV